MVTLFNQEKIMNIHDYHVVEDTRKDGIIGLSFERAMTVLGVSEADQPKYVEMPEQQMRYVLGAIQKMKFRETGW